MTFAELLAIVRMHGGDARLYGFDGGSTLYVIGLGMTPEESACTVYWDDGQTTGELVERMAARLLAKGLDMYGLAS